MEGPCVSRGRHASQGPYSPGAPPATPQPCHSDAERSGGRRNLLLPTPHSVILSEVRRQPNAVEGPVSRDVTTEPRELFHHRKTPRYLAPAVANEPQAVGCPTFRSLKGGIPRSPRTWDFCHVPPTTLSFRRRAQRRQEESAFSSTTSAFTGLRSRSEAPPYFDSPPIASRNSASNDLAFPAFTACDSAFSAAAR